MKYIDADKLKSIIKAHINERNEWMKGIDKSDRQDQLWSDLNKEDISILEIITSLQQEKISFKKVVNEKTGRISLIPYSGEKYFLVLYFGADTFVWTPVHKLQHLYCEIEAIGGARVASDVHMWAKSAAIGDVIRRDNFSVIRISEEQYNKDKNESER